MKERQTELFTKCRSRISRAVEHGNRIAEIWNEGVSERLLEPSVLIADDGSGTISVTPVRKAWPEEMELELGEYLYQLRAALDGAVYACAIEDTGENPPPKASGTEFPICEHRKDWTGQSRKIGSLNEGRQRFIALMQPFEEPLLDTNLRVLNTNRCLRFLNELARIDRHRRLHAFGTYAVAGTPQFDLPPGVSLSSLQVHVPGNIVGKTLAEFTLSGWKRGMTLRANPNIDLDLSLEGFEESCHPNDSFPHRLEMIVKNVRIVIGLLEKDRWIEPQAVNAAGKSINSVSNGVKP